MVTFNISPTKLFSPKFGNIHPMLLTMCHLTNPMKQKPSAMRGICRLFLHLVIRVETTKSDLSLCSLTLVRKERDNCSFCLFNCQFAIFLILKLQSCMYRHIMLNFSPSFHHHWKETWGVPSILYFGCFTIAYTHNILNQRREPKNKFL